MGIGEKLSVNCRRARLIAQAVSEGVVWNGEYTLEQLGNYLRLNPLDYGGELERAFKRRANMEYIRKRVRQLRAAAGGVLPVKNGPRTWEPPLAFPFPNSPHYPNYKSESEYETDDEAEIKPRPKNAAKGAESSDDD